LAATVQRAQAQEVLQTEDGEESSAEASLAEFNEQSTAAVAHPADTEEGPTQGASLAEFSEESLAAGPGAAEAEALDTGINLAEFDAQSEAAGPVTEEDTGDVPSQTGSNNMFLPFLQAAVGDTERIDAASASAAADSPAGVQSVQADFNGDGYHDLAIGVPYEDLAAAINAGVVHVIYGAEGGLTAAGSDLWSEDTAGILGIAETDDRFGWSLASCDCNGDGYYDLAIGEPYEDLGVVGDAGVVHIIFGSAGGLTAAGNELWSEDTAGILGVAETDDKFGWSLACCDFNADGYDDLAIGEPYEDLDGVGDAGVVHVIYGSEGGLVAAGNDLWSQDSAGIADAAETGDHFGYSVQ